MLPHAPIHSVVLNGTTLNQNLQLHMIYGLQLVHAMLDKPYVLLLQLPSTQQTGSSVLMPPYLPQLPQILAELLPAWNSNRII
jgi:hypothetical protein